MKKLFFMSGILILLCYSQTFSQDTYEPNNTYETAAVVTCGQELSAYIQIEDDVDWYSIEMAESGVLEVAVTSVPDNLNIEVEVHTLVNNELTLIADDRIIYPEMGDNMFVAAVVNAGTYYIKVIDKYHDAFSPSDPYEMELTCNPNALELNQIYEEAAPIALDTCFEANIYGDNFLYTESQDVDWYEVYTENPGILEVAVTSVPDNIDINVEVYQVIENTLTLIANDRVVYPEMGVNMLSVAVVNPGTYLISVNDNFNDLFNKDTYSFCTTFTPNFQELNQIYTEASLIPMDTCFEANIYGDNMLYTESQDVDWYEMIIPNNNYNLEISITSVPDNININLEVYQLINDELTLVADDGENYPELGESMFVTTVVDSGSYLISVNDESNDYFNEDTYLFCTGLVGIEEELLDDQFSVYPNPNNGRFKLKWLNKGVQVNEINLYDFLGKRIMYLQNDLIRSDEISISTHTLDKGIYLLQIFTNEGLVTKKIYVQ